MAEARVALGNCLTGWAGDAFGRFLQEPKTKLMISIRYKHAALCRAFLLTVVIRRHSVSTLEFR